MTSTDPLDVSGGTIDLVATGALTMSATAASTWSTNGGSLVIQTDGASDNLTLASAKLLTMTAVNDFAINGNALVSVNSDGGVLGFGNLAHSFAVNIATAGTRTVTVGSTTSSSKTILRAGSGGIQLTTAGLMDLDCDGQWDLKFADHASQYQTDATKVQVIGEQKVSAEAITARAVVCLVNSSGTARIQHADADDAARQVPWGIASAGAGGAGTTISCASFSGSKTWILCDSTPVAADIGKSLWLSKTPGKTTLTEPATSGDLRIHVGIVEATNGTIPLATLQIWRMADVP